MTFYPRLHFDPMSSAFHNDTPTTTNSSSEENVVPVTVEDGGADGCPYGGRDPFTPLLVCLQLAIAVVAIIGNGVVVYLICTVRALHTANNLFVCALAGADLLVGLNIPFYITFYFDVPYKCDRTLCAIRYLWGLYVTVLSVVLLIGVALDRYLSVIHSLKYHCFMRFKLAKRIIAFVYLYVALIVGAPAYWAIQWYRPKECDLVYILAFWYTCLVVLFHVAFTLVVTVCIYFCIFKEAWKKLHQPHYLLTPKAAQIHAEAKTAKTMVLILGVHMFSLIPYLVVVIWRYFAEGDAAEALSDAKKFIVVLYFGKSAVNPLIYGWKNKDLRREFLRVTGRDPAGGSPTGYAVALRPPTAVVAVSAAVATSLVAVAEATTAVANASLAWSFRHKRKATSGGDDASAVSPGSQDLLKTGQKPTEAMEVSNGGLCCSKCNELSDSLDRVSPEQLQLRQLRDADLTQLQCACGSCQLPPRLVERLA